VLTLRPTLPSKTRSSTAKALFASIASALPANGFGDAAGSIIKEAKLFRDSTKTDVVVTFANSSLIDAVSNDTVTQQFFVQDTNEAVSVDVYYDRLFGTYAFKKLTPPGRRTELPQPNLPDLPRLCMPDGQSLCKLP
jgi:hypothetical protein